MTQHFVLNINPQAQYDWDKYILRNPITGERPDLTKIIAQALGNNSGDYLVAVNIEVKVLEKAPTASSEAIALKLTPTNQAINLAQLPELIAS